MNENLQKNSKNDNLTQPTFVPMENKLRPEFTEDLESCSDSCDDQYLDTVQSKTNERSGSHSRKL